METATYANAEDLFDDLDALNEGGRTPEFAAVDSNGNPFVAALGDEGDSVALVYVTTGPEGWPTGRTACDECGADGPSGWKPTWPVTVLRAASA